MSVFNCVFISVFNVGEWIIEVLGRLGFGLYFVINI